MKIAILGRGKTGSKVAELCSEKNISHTVFHSQNPLTESALKEHDVLIAFVPGQVMLDYLPLILKNPLPVVSGATGVDFPDTLDTSLKEAQMPWIQGHNFSLGMTIVKKLFDVMNKAPILFEDQWQATIHEIHHTQKLDAPSGTALRWGEWFGHDCNITSERVGDIVGDHAFTFEGPYETISIQHTAKDRRLFASGALWAAQLSGRITAGFHWFEHLATKELGL